MAQLVVGFVQAVDLRAHVGEAYAHFAREGVQAEAGMTADLGDLLAEVLRHDVRVVSDGSDLGPCVLADPSDLPAEFHADLLRYLVEVSRDLLDFLVCHDPAAFPAEVVEQREYILPPVRPGPTYSAAPHAFRQG